MHPQQYPDTAQPAAEVAEVLAAAERLVAEASVPLDGATQRTIQIAARAADRLAAWHCPAEWQAAARLVALPTSADPATDALSTARVTPRVADLVHRFHSLNRTLYPQPRGRPELARPAFQHLQKLFIASFTDEPVTFVALGHMLAQLEDLGQQQSADKLTQAEHLRVACLPMLERFGMGDEQRQAAEALLRLLEPARAEQIAGWIRQHDARREEILGLVEATLRANLPAHGAAVTVTIRPVRAARVFEQSGAYPHLGPDLDRDQAARALAGRIAVDVTAADEATCYLILGCLHRLGRHVTGTLRDYLGAPKFNAYRMIHTTVAIETTRGERPTVDCFICTEAAQQSNRRGRAAEWEQGSAAPEQLRQAWWHRKERELSILRTAEPGAYAQPTYVFTPLGELHTLPSQSTPVDFAFQLHSEQGQFYAGAQVNGVEVPVDFHLANADIINIRFDPRLPSRLRREWLQTVQTPAATARIQKALAYREQGADRGKLLLEQAVEQQCKRLGITLSKVRLSAYFDEAAHWYQCGDSEALYQQVAGGRPAPEAVALRIATQEVAQRVGYPDGRPLGLRAERVRVAQCCKPAVDTEIAGHFYQPNTPHERITLHATDCRWLPHDARTTELTWRPPADESQYEFLVLGADRKRLLTEVLEPFHAQGHALHRVLAERLVDDAAHIQVLAEVRGGDDASALVAAIKAVPGIREVATRPLAMTPQEARELRRHLAAAHPYRFNQPAYRLGDFLGRAEELDAVKAFIARPEPVGPLVVYGPWRIGKTSLLRHLERSGIGDTWVGVYVDCQPDRGPGLAGLLGEVIRASSERLSQIPDLLGGGLTYLTTQERQQLAEDPVGVFAQFCRRTAAALTSRRDIRLVVLMDEFSSLDDQVQQGRLDPRIFDNLRYLMGGELDVAFVLVVQAAALTSMHSLTSRGAGLLEIAQLLRLGPLDLTAAQALLATEAEAVGLSWRAEALEYVVTVTARNPYLLKVVGYQAVEQLKRTDRRVFELPDAEQAAKLSIATDRHADLYFKHMTGAPVTAGACRLLHRLGSARTDAWSPEPALLPPGQRDADAARELLAALVRLDVLAAGVTVAGTPEFRVQIPLFAAWAAAYQPARITGEDFTHA